jgi:arabinan endo-1,5-alpha-L-arabinosidase
MYYSCSTFGSQVSAIGLATSPDLTTWTDEGVVVYSNNSTAYNAIDAAVFRDAIAKVWLVFGSHWGGIYMVQLDTKTGKQRNSTLYNLAAHPDAEAAYIIRRGKFYYLLYNAGRCCDGVNSTYEVMMGRSTRPQGPYVDRSGKPLTSGGGTSFLSTSGRYIGPGHVGLFTESVQYLTYHFYDGNANGRPTLRISNLRWDSAGWPYASADWINDGRYKVVNRGNGLVWDGLGGEAFEPVVQNAYSDRLSQQWDFTSLGNGAYNITCVYGGLSVGLAGGATEAGAKLDLYSYFGSSSQQWNVERASDGTYVYSSVNGNRVVDIPNGTTATGTQLQIWDYNGFDAQKWQISAP